MGAYSDRVIADGASAYWRLGEPSGTTAVDAKGAANGTISGGVTLNQPGALSDANTAMTFNGTTGKITTPSRTLAPPYTVEAWIKFSDTSQRPLLSLSGADFVYIGVLNGQLFVYQAGGSSSTRPVNDNAWHHGVYVLTASTETFYVDGLVDTASVSSAVVAPLTGPLVIGWNAEAGQWWSGGLDEVAIYPRALTATEVAAHYTLARQSVSWPGVPWWVQIQGDDALDNFNVWEPITPSNTVDLPRGVSGGLWVGSGGDVAAVMQNNVMPVVFAAVPTGAWLPIAAKRINATGTTATGLVALYEA